jgi:HK97 family phage major capsid protein
VDEKELKQLTEKIDHKFETLGSEITKGKADVDGLIKSLDAIRADLKGVADKAYVEKMQEHLDAQEAKINELELKRGDLMPVEEQINKFFETETFKKAKNQKGVAGSFTIKATITTSNSFTQTNSPIIQYDREPGLVVDPRNPFILTQLIPTSFTSSDNIDWVERSAETDSSAAVAEAATFSAGDVSWTSYKLPVEKIGEYAVCSREKLEDTDFVRSEIMEVLGYHIPNKREYYMWNGTGASNQLSGFLGSATYNAPKAFALPSGVNPVAGANEYDVLAAAILQIELGANSTNSQSSLVAGYMPTAIIVNPVNWYNMTRLKDTTNQYLVGMDGVMRVNGVPVYKSTRIAAGTYLVGDFNQAKRYTRRAIEVRMWDQNSTDPIYDLVTFTASGRDCLRVGHSTTGRRNYAFVTGTFAAGIVLVAG